MKILLDTNIILDFALKRAPFYDVTIKIIRTIEELDLHPIITACSITDIYYIARKIIGKEKTIEFIKELLIMVDVADVNKNIIVEAINSGISDFEDAIQIFAAKNVNIDAIVSRNIKDFKHSEVMAYTPTEFLTMIKQGK